MTIQISIYLRAVRNVWTVIACLSENTIQLTLIDMILDSPLDGLDAYRMIRKGQPTIKCVLVTGFAETDRVKSALMEGADGIIHKPFTKEVLTQSVRKYLDLEKE